MIRRLAMILTMVMMGPLLAVVTVVVVGANQPRR
jgi:hypothetical protein